MAPSPQGNPLVHWPKVFYRPPRGVIGTHFGSLNLVEVAVKASGAPMTDDKKSGNAQQTTSTAAAFVTLLFEFW